MKSPLKIVFIFFSFLFFIPSNIYGQIYFSNDFDSAPDYDGCRDYPDPWSSYGWNHSKACGRVFIDNSDDAFLGADSEGKSGRIEWPTGGQVELGFNTFITSWNLGGERPEELWIGFWHKFEDGWSMACDDSDGICNEHKWLYLPEGSDRTMFNFNSDGIIWFDGRAKVFKGTLQGKSPFITGSWRKIVFHLKHNTGNSYNGSIRAWINGVEVAWQKKNAGFYDPPDNTHMIFHPTDNYFGNNAPRGDMNSSLTFGYQSRYWTHQNTELWDNIIIASTKKEVDDFLDKETSPLPPVGLQVVSPQRE